MTRYVILTFLLLIFMTSGAGSSLVTKTNYSSGWTIEIVDAGETNSIALDSYGHPHISYYKNGDLMYAVKTESEWNIETVDSKNNIGVYSSIALDSNDCPHISYIDETNEYLKYAVKNGPEWVIETVDTTNRITASLTSIKIDSYDNPHVLYYDKMHGKIRYAFKTGSDWIIENISGGEPHNVLALDSDNNPNIAFRTDMGKREIRLGIKTNSNWNIETVRPTSTSRVISFDLDSNNNPYIICGADVEYYSYLICLYKTNNIWSYDLVDTGGFMGDYNSIVLDSNKQPHIIYTYLDWDKYELRYAKKIGSKWIKIVIDSGEIEWNSISCDSNNKPHISYTSHGYLMYATYDNFPPCELSIDGPKLVRANVEQSYAIVSTDIDNDPIWYYFDWGDGTHTDWTGPSSSDEELTKSHTWSERGGYTIKVKAKDINGAESEWLTLEVTVSRSRFFSSQLLQFLHNCPNLIKILKFLL